MEPVAVKIFGSRDFLPYLPLAGSGLNLKFILGRRAALAFAVGQPWFVWGLPVFSNVQYGGCMGEQNTYGTIPWYRR